MPPIKVRLIEDAFSTEQKQQIARDLGLQDDAGRAGMRPVSEEGS